MATIKGKWLFNEMPSLPNDGISQFITFDLVNAAEETVTAYKIVVGNKFGVVSVAFSYYEDGSSPTLVYYATNGWTDQTYRTIDFGTTEQEVSDEFYTWFTTNATQIEETPIATTITYNDSTLTTLEAGQGATLACNGKKAKSNIVISFVSAGTITYNGVDTSVEAGKTATLECSGKKMISDVVVRMAEALSAPTISLDGDTLSIYDESGLATSFDILVDGEVKGSVSKGVE